MAEDAKPPRLSPEQCRQQADQCRKMAQGATPEHRVMLDHMAEIWDRMAGTMERTADYRNQSPR